MKTILTLLMTVSLSLSASPYWVQVSSIKSGSEPAASFLKDISDNGYKYEIIDDTVHKKVCIGSFKTQKEALEALPKIKCKIAFDAFVVNASVAEKPVVAVVPPAAEKAAEEVLAPLPVVMTPPQPCLCVYDAHLLHKVEIEDALAYYKASSYYTFKEEQ